MRTVEATWGVARHCLWRLLNSLCGIGPAPPSSTCAVQSELTSGKDPVLGFSSPGMTNEARTELPEHYNVPGQRRGYTSCTASSSDEGSSNLVSPDLEEEVVVVGEAQELAFVDESDVEENDPMDTIKRAVKSAPSRPPRVIDSLPASSAASTTASTEYYNLCHPPPLDNPVPTIPRRKPYISNPDLGAPQYGPQRSNVSTWSERSCQPR